LAADVSEQLCPWQPPPLELLRIALGFTLPILLTGHAANTRLAWELFGMPSDYARVVANVWFADAQRTQLGVMAPGWLHCCFGLHVLLNRRPLYRKLRYGCSPSGEGEHN
jgi:adenylate cyclase